MSRRALTLPEGPRMLDCGICMDEPRLSRATRTSEFWALARGARSCRFVCFPPALPVVCRSRVSRPRGGGWLALACARVGGGRSSLCGGVWGFLPLCNCYAMNQPASQPRAHSRASPGVASAAPPCDRELHGAHTGRGGHVAVGSVEPTSLNISGGTLHVGLWNSLEESLQPDDSNRSADF